MLRFSKGFSGGAGEAAAYALPFLLTNARPQLALSVHPAHLAFAHALQAAAAVRLNSQPNMSNRWLSLLHASPCPLAGPTHTPATQPRSVLSVTVQDDAAFLASGLYRDSWNVIDLSKDSVIGDEAALPLPGHFISLLFPLGHIKSTKPKDETFIANFEASPKWLRVEK